MATDLTLEQITLITYSEQNIQESKAWMTPQSLPNLVIEDPYDVAQELSYHIMCIRDTLNQIKTWDDKMELVDEINKSYPDSEIKTEVIRIIGESLLE